jgi:hypothetical protein
MLAGDIGEGRIKAMDEEGIQMQVVSYGNPAQLAPANQAASLTHYFIYLPFVASKARVSATTRSWNFGSRTSAEPNIG